MKTITVFVSCMLFTIHAISQQVPVVDETFIQLETVVNEDTTSISFSWNEILGNYEVGIYRKSVNSTAWEKTETLPPHTNEYTDYNVHTAEKYEYRIESSKPNDIRAVTYVTAGIRCKETEYRGEIILLVDSVFVNPLQNELSRLETDLIGDGWEIIRKNISRNSTVKQVKDFIRGIYYSDFKNVKSVFLVGHIPVPYSGDYAFDAHVGEHDGAWPTDLYYGDMNESFWTDSKVNDTLATHPENHNIPGDGKFDRYKLEQNQTVLLAVGRVDFFDLPAFSQSEIELMRKYLDKDHAFRHKIIKPKMQALIDDNLDPLPATGPGGVILSYEVISLSGWRNFTALVNYNHIKSGKVFSDGLNDSYIWTYGCGWGTLTSCANLGSVSDFVNYAPKTVFTGFYGSWFGDWNTTNNFLRSALASDGWILTSCWSGRPHYVFHQMGMGETIGSCVQRTQNNNNTYYGGLGVYSRGIDINLMGDPTLRMHIVSPVSSLNSEISGNNSIKLNWQSPEDEIIGYYVYKLNTTTNKFERISSQAVNDSSYTDSSPEQGNNYYMVRALQLTKSASGSYYNLSQGVFDTIQFNLDNVPDIVLKSENDFRIFPNPFTNNLTIETGNNCYYNINIRNINGQLLFVKEVEGPLFQLNLSSFLSGVYFITITSKDVVTTRKIIKQ